MTEETHQSPAPIVDTAGFSAARLSRIDNLFEVDVRRGLVPGAVLLVERHGETVLRRAWGYRNRAAGAAMTFDTIFRIYSMTKPIVSMVTMMLAAEGRLHLAQPVSDFIPSFADVQVWHDGGRVAPERPATIQDLLRHTSGLSYEANGGAIAPLYRDAQVLASDITNEEFVERLVTVPLVRQPGRVWEYGHSSDVLGRVVEVVAGRALGAVLRQRLFDPLGMADTGFVVGEADHDRVAEALPGDTLSAEGKPLFDPRQPRAFEAGGMGLVSTLDDYARFCRMLLASGASDRHVFLSPPVFDFMTADHIGPGTGIAKGDGFLPGPGFGFGLGFAVRTALGGGSAFPGSLGELNWSGVGGTYFWVDPDRDLFAILLTQSPRQRFRYRAVLKTMVYDALVGGAGLKAEKKKRKAVSDDAPGLRIRG